MMVAMKKVDDTEDEVNAKNLAGNVNVGVLLERVLCVSK